jgi:DNA-directed RNA polymerase subunit RPC12/RpoP
MSWVVMCPRCRKGILKAESLHFANGEVYQVALYFVCPVCGARFVGPSFIEWR